MTRLRTNAERDGLGFTPGPWALEEGDGAHIIRMGEAITTPWAYRSHLVVEYEHGLYVDGDYPESQKQYAEAEANAHLIAAAPDMLEELEQQADGSATIAALLKGQQSAVAECLIGMLNLQEQAARAMIAKARGGA